MRVSPEFEDLVSQIEADFKKRFDASPSRTKLTKLVARRVRTKDLLGDDKEEDRRSDFI